MKPKLQVSINEEEVARARENTELKVDYELEVKERMKRKGIFDDNVAKMHVMIVDEFCTELMTDKLTESHDYETAWTDDFTELLKKISGVMCQSTDTTYSYWSLVDAIIRLVTMKQTAN